MRLTRQDFCLGHYPPVLSRGLSASPILKFKFRNLEVRVTGVRQDKPPKMESIKYEIIVDSDESDRRLDLLHENVMKFGAVFNTLAPGT